VRGTQRGLGSLARDAGLLGVIGVLCYAAGGADAAPAPHSFTLTISATSVANFDHTDCDAGTRAVGVRTATFRTSRPVVVHFAGGRIRTTVVRGLRGTVKLSGTNTDGITCGGSPAAQPQRCATTTRRFADARVTLSSTAPGSITIQPPRVTLRRAHCPEEPGDVAALPLGPPPGPLHIAVSTLTSPRTTRVTFTASARRTKNYESPEEGATHQRTSWKFTLARD
jgi:hypothetical protein